jgi:hypothetical protein
VQSTETQILQKKQKKETLLALRALKKFLALKKI